MNPVTLLQELISIPGPPGQERQIREAVASHLNKLHLDHTTDAKGNLLVPIGEFDTTAPATVIVTAHLDEIAMIVRLVLPSGALRVGPLGGLQPWKLGEGPVEILAPEAPLPGVLSFGSMHTAEPSSTARQADSRPLTWDHAEVFTGLSAEALQLAGVRPGTRVVVGRQARTLVHLGPYVAGRFLDDRADLVSWLIALEEIQKKPIPGAKNILFAATTSEEVGGEGSQFLLQKHQPDVCIALELGPVVPDANVFLTDQPTVWATDSYASMTAEDGDLLASVGARLGQNLQFQALSRGGSDASCAAGRGLCARPITLGLPMQNTHGFEIMHPNAMAQLGRLTVELVRQLVVG